MRSSKYEQKLTKDVKKRFQNDVQNHSIEPLHKEGDIVRAWKCSNNGSSIFKFTVVATPGWLMIYGDMGECMWSRSHDMIDFVRSSGRSLDYFSEKASKDCIIKDNPTELIEEWFEGIKEDWEDCSGEKWGSEQDDELETIRGEYETYHILGDFLKAVFESDLVDEPPRTSSYTYCYLWKVEAVVWLVERLDRLAALDELAAEAQKLGLGY